MQRHVRSDEGRQVRHEFERGDLAGRDGRLAVRWIGKAPRAADVQRLVHAETHAGGGLLDRHALARKDHVLEGPQHEVADAVGGEEIIDRQALGHESLEEIALLECVDPGRVVDPRLHEALELLGGHVDGRHAVKRAARARRFAAARRFP